MACRDGLYRAEVGRPGKHCVDVDRRPYLLPLCRSRPMRLLLVFVALGLAGAHVASAQTPTVLADGRAHAPTADVSGWPTHPALRQATEAARAYWRSQDAEYEEDVRFFDAAEGAFSEPGTRQHAVLYFMS